jgi:hypothetical protein
VDVRDNGRHRMYQLDGRPLKPIHDWVKNFERSWAERFERLDVVLSELKEKERGDCGSGSSSPAAVALPANTQILITREFDAPKHLVFRAWTTPELIKQWRSGDRGSPFVASRCSRSIRRYLKPGSNSVVAGMLGVVHAFGELHPAFVRRGDELHGNGGALDDV